MSPAVENLLEMRSLKWEKNQQPSQPGCHLSLLRLLCGRLSPAAAAAAPPCLLLQCQQQLWGVAVGVGQQVL
jgi:hypothetical protein